MPLADRDWTVNAFELEWSCRHTVGHISRALLSYTIHLANRARARIAYPRNDDPALSIPQLIALVRAMAGALDQVVRAAPAGIRGWHPQGVADVDGFVAMGCSEILIHSSDIAQALGAPLGPPDDLCERVAHSFPLARSSLTGGLKRADAPSSRSRRIRA